MNLRLRRHRGFTLLELLVVIAILATVAGGLLVAYDGLDTDAAEAQATFNMAAIDKAVRTYRTINKAFPDNLDALVTNNTTLPAFFAGLPAKLQGSDADVTSDATAGDDGKLAFYALTVNGAAALSNAGITTLRYIDDANNLTTDIPNRAFDDPDRGHGVGVAVASGIQVAIIETVNHGEDATETKPRLRDIAGLPAGKEHIVVAFGLGNNSSMVAGPAANLSEAPWYTKVAKDEYGRFLLLFHLGSDTDATAGVSEDEIFETARFLGVLDTRGDWIDEEFAEFTNQKS